jgi:hypothetical protein
VPSKNNIAQKHNTPCQHCCSSTAVEFVCSAKQAATAAAEEEEGEHCMEASCWQGK